MYLTSEEKDSVLKIIHTEFLTEILQVIARKYKKEDEIHFEDILDGSEAFRVAYLKLIGFKRIPNADEKSEYIKKIIHSYVDLMLIGIKNSNDKEFYSFFNKAKIMWGQETTLKIFRKIRDSHGYPTLGLNDILPESDKKDLPNVIHAIDIFSHIPLEIINKFPTIKALCDNFFSLIDNLLGKSTYQKAVPNSSEMNKPNEQFISAVKANELEKVKQALALGADINAVMNNTDQTNTFTALFYSCCKGYYQLSKLLINKGAKIDSIDSKNGYYPMHGASQYGHLSIVELLVKEAKASIEVSDKKGNTPLHLAAQHSQQEVVKFLIENRPLYKSYLNQTNFQDQTAYDVARKKGDEKIINCFRLKEDKAEVKSDKKSNSTSRESFFNQNKTSSQPTEQKNDAMSFDDLLSLPEKMNKYKIKLLGDTVASTNQLFAAIANEAPVSVIREILKQNPQLIYTKDKDGNNAMHISALYDNQDSIELIELLCRANCSLTEHNNFGIPPLHLAIAFGNQKIPTKLTSLGVPNDQRTDGPPRFT